jgi:hypothetical protein
MSYLTTHLDDLLAVLRASGGLHRLPRNPIHLRAKLADALEPLDPALAGRIRGLDEWHAETLAEFVADAHALAKVLDAPAVSRSDAETRA